VQHGALSADLAHELDQFRAYLARRQHRRLHVAQPAVELGSLRRQPISDLA
jgi:hypothetical protein